MYKIDGQIDRSSFVPLSCLYKKMVAAMACIAPVGWWVGWLHPVPEFFACRHGHGSSSVLTGVAQG